MADVGAPLSPKEQALWLFGQYVPEGGVLNVAFAVRVATPLRWWPLHAALRHLARRHPLLRARFPALDGIGVRQVLDADDPRAQIPLRILAVNPDDLDARLAAFADEPFDLAEQPPIRVAEFVVTDGHVLAVSVNHLVYDAHSAVVLRRELLALYAALAASGQVPAELAGVVEPVPAEPAGPESIRYWREHLAGATHSRRELTIGRTGPRAATFPGSHRRHRLSAAAAAAVNDLPGRLSATRSTVALAGYSVLLSRHGMGSDVIVGVPVDARGSRPHDAIGYYVNVVALRTEVKPDAPFRDVVRAARDTFLAGIAHAQVSVDESFPGWYEESGLQRQPVFRHMLNFNDRPDDTEQVLAGLDARMQPITSGHSRLDLELVVLRRGDGFELGANYATDVFTAEEIGALLQRYDELLALVGRDPDLRVQELPQWTATAADPPPEPAPEPEVETASAPPELVDDLVSLWRTVLANPDLTESANFFLSGGNSLLAARLVAQIKKTKGVKVSLRTMFRSPTPSALAPHVAALLAPT